jgi:DNA polymerase I-like protein with 3'-5' exonuclease and polymerase domains
MIGAIMEGKDLHSFTVALTTPGVKYEEVVAAKKTDPKKQNDRQKWLVRQRQAKKAVGFGIIYGAGPPKISTEIDISEEDWQAKIEEMPQKTFERRVTRLMKNNPLLTEEQAIEQVGRHSVAGDKIAEYFDAFPGVKGFMEQTPVICRHRMHFDEENNPRDWEFYPRSPGAKPTSWSGHSKPFGYVQTLCGRYRRLEDIDHKNYFYRSEAERQAVNTRIQGSAADITKAAMLRIEHHPELHMMGVMVLNQVHDEIVMEVPEEYAEAAAPIVQHCMEHPFGDGPEDDALSVPIPVDLKIVDNWAEAK